MKRGWEVEEKEEEADDKAIGRAWKKGDGRNWVITTSTTTKTTTTLASLFSVCLHKLMRKLSMNNKTPLHSFVSSYYVQFCLYRKVNLIYGTDITRSHSTFKLNDTVTTMICLRLVPNYKRLTCCRGDPWEIAGSRDKVKRQRKNTIKVRLNWHCMHREGTCGYWVSNEGIVCNMTTVTIKVTANDTSIEIDREMER